MRRYSFDLRPTALEGQLQDGSILAFILSHFLVVHHQLPEIVFQVGDGMKK